MGVRLCPLLLAGRPFSLSTLSPPDKAVPVSRRGVHDSDRGARRVARWRGGVTMRGSFVFAMIALAAVPGTVFAMGLDIDELDAGAPSQGRHIYLSRDGGLTFQPVVDDSADVHLPNGPPMAAHPTDPDVVYFTFGSSFQGFGSDLYRYDDATLGVTKTHNDYHRLPAIAFNPADPSFMYLGLGVENVT